LTEIRTARLALRRPQGDDLEAMFAITSDPRAMRYWSTLPHASLDITRVWLHQQIERTALGGEDFVIEFEGRAIGTVGAGRLPDFGFIIHPDYWGHGLATEASRGFIDYVFGARPVEALLADVDPCNVASLRVLKRLGFVETGTAKNTFLLGEEWCDSVYLRLDRPTG
jgi:ribosomal-protein-alanine N-acetyltransferase